MSRSDTTASMRVVVDRDHVDLAPGASVTLVVTIANTGRVAVTPELQLTGVDGAQVAGTQVQAVLAAGEARACEITFGLPSEAAAGTRRVAVVVRDRSGRAQPAAAHVRVVTGSAADVALRLSPRDVRGRLRGGFRVHLDNQGDREVTLDLRADGDGLGIRVRPDRVTLPPGASVRLRGRVRSRRPAVVRDRRTAFVVTAQGTTTPVAGVGSFHQRTVLDGVLLKAVAVLAVLGLWAGGAVAAVRHFGSSGFLSGGAPATSTTSTVPAPSDTTTAGGGGASGDSPAGDGAGAGGDAPDARAGGAGAPGGADAGGAATGDGATGRSAARASIGGSVTGPDQVAGIAVTLTRVSLGDSAGSEGKLVPGATAPRTDAVSEQRTTTDDGGRFRFASGLDVPALYRVTAVKPGFEAASMVAELTATAPSVDLALVLEAATGRLGGRVTGPDGGALTDATITVSSSTITYTTTVASSGDAAGTWSIDGVATPASYVVAAVSPGYATASVVVNLAGGEARVGVDLTLQQGAGTIRGLVASRGVGVGGATVTATQVGGDVVRSTTTLTQPGLLGRFDLPGLPLGRYTLTVEGDGWLTETSQVVLDRGDVEVALTDLRLATATVQGRVYQQALVTPACGYPANDYDPTTVRAQPCGNVGVTVSNLEGTWRTTSAGSDGGFVISGIAPGTYTVSFERFGYVPASLTVTLEAGDVTDVGPSGPTGAEPIVLELVARAGEGLAVVQGVLRDASDPTVALRSDCLLTRIGVSDAGGTRLDAMVRPDQCPLETLNLPAVVPPSPVLPCAASTGVGARACWLTGGGIRLLGLPAGASTLRIGALGFDDAVQVVQVPSGGTVELGVVLLQPLATLTGVVMGPNDTPLTGARVLVTPSDPTLAIPDEPATPSGGWHACTYALSPTETVHGVCVETGSDGFYRFGEALRTGTYRVIAPIDRPVGWAPGAAVPLDHKSLERVVELRAGSVTNQDLNLRRYGAVYGVVQTPNASGGFDFVDDTEITVNGREASSPVYCSTVETPAADPAEQCRISRSAGGNYRVDRLRERPGGGYDITFSKTDGTIVYEDRVDPIDGGLGFNVELLHNQILTVQPWGVSGSVTWDDDGAGPLATVDGATVAVTGVTAYQVLALPPYREATVRTFTYTTDADGAFASTSLQRFVSPQVSITVSKPGYQSITVPAVPRAAVDTVVGAVRLEPLAQTLSGSVALSPGLVGGSDIITDAGEIFSRLSATAIARQSGQRTVTSVTAGGTFAMPGLRPGTYDVTISGPGLGGTGTATATLAVGGAGTTGATGITVSRLGRLRVKATDGSAAAVKGAVVTLSRGGTVVRTGVTCVDPNEVGGVVGCAAGTVTFDDLTPSGSSWTFDVAVAKAGYSTVTSTGVDLATVRSREVTAPAMVRYGWIEGRVVALTRSSDTTGPALAGAEVRVTSGPSLPASAVDLTVTTGTDGRFSLVGTIPAATDYTVTVSSPGYGTVTVTGVTVANAGRTSVPATGDVKLVAVPATVHGTVTEGADPLAGVTVTAVGSGVPAETTGATGQWSLTLPPGLYTLVFHHPDGRPDVTRVLTLAAGADVQYDISMAGPTGTVFGVVAGTDTAGATTPLSGVTVEWFPDGATVVSGSATTSTSGGYTFPSIPADTAITVRVTASGYQAASVTGLTVAVGQTLYVPVSLTPNGRSLTVSVVSATGATPLVGVRVVATSGSTQEDAVTGAGGTASLTLRTGKWTLTTQQAGTVAVAHYDATSSGSGSVQVSVPSPDKPMPSSPTLTLSPWESIRVVTTGRANAIEASPATVTLGVTSHGTSVSAVVNGVPVTLAETATAGTFTATGPWGPVTFSLAVTATGYTRLDETGLTLTANTVTPVARTLTATTRQVAIGVASGETGALDGVVVDATLVGAGNVVTTVTGTTAGGGSVTLDLPPSANWKLATRSAGSATIVGYGNVPHVNKSALPLSVPVSPGTPTGTSVTLLPVSASITGSITSGFTGLFTGNVQSEVGATVTAALGSWTRSTPALTAASTYSLSVWQATGWSVTGTLPSHDAPAAQAVTVGAGGATADLRFARRAATLSGTVTDATTQPVAGATVTVRRHATSVVLGTLTTDAQGDYSLAGLDPVETYDVTFDTSGRSDGLKRQPVTYTTTQTTSGAGIVRDHTLSAAAGSVVVTVTGALRGQPSVAHAVGVAPTALLTNADPNVIDPIAVPLASNGTGGWTGTMSGLPSSNEYVVTLTVPTGYTGTQGEAGPLVVQHIAVTSSTPGPAAFTLSPANTTVDVTIQRHDASAYAGTAATLKGGGLGGAGQAGTSLGGGVFRFTGVPLSPAADGGTPYHVELATTTGTVTTIGGSLPTFEVTGATALTQTLQRLTAIVKVPPDVNSAPAEVTDATVSVTVDAGAPVAFVRSGATTTYTVEGVLAGRALSVTADSPTGDTSTPWVPPALFTTAHTESNTFTLALTKVGYTVTVSSSATGASFTGGTITATAKTTGVVASATFTGSSPKAVAMTLEPGVWTFVVAATGHVSQTSTDRTVAAGGTLAVTLPYIRTVAYTVTSSDGSPLTNLKVALSSAPATALGTVAGNVVTFSLAPGTYTLEVSADEHVKATGLSLTVSGSATTTQAATGPELDHYETITITVTDPDGDPVTDATGTVTVNSIVYPLVQVGTTNDYRAAGPFAGRKLSYSISNATLSDSANNVGANYADDEDRTLTVQLALTP